MIITQTLQNDRMVWEKHHPPFKLAEKTELTNELECEDTLGHGPLNVILLRCCVVVACQQVALREHRVRETFTKHITAPLITSHEAMQEFSSNRVIVEFWVRYRWYWRSSAKTEILPIYCSPMWLQCVNKTWQWSSTYLWQKHPLHCLSSVLSDLMIM